MSTVMRVVYMLAGPFYVFLGVCLIMVVMSFFGVGLTGKYQ